MKLSTGKVAFPIEFDNGDKEVIYFNPRDRGIQDRIKNFEKLVEERTREIDFEKYKDSIEQAKKTDINENNIDELFDMSKDELKSIESHFLALRELENEYNSVIKSEIDKVFDSEISNVVFKYCEPFDVVKFEDESGDIKTEAYIKHFIRWLMIELKRYGEQSSSAMEKHVAKYRK